MLAQAQKDTAQAEKSAAEYRETCAALGRERDDARQKAAALKGEVAALTKLLPIVQAAPKE